MNALYMVSLRSLHAPLTRAIICNIVHNALPSSPCPTTTSSVSCSPRNSFPQALPRHHGPSSFHCLPLLSCLAHPSAQRPPALDTVPLLCQIFLCPWGLPCHESLDLLPRRPERSSRAVQLHLAYLALEGLRSLLDGLVDHLSALHLHLENVWALQQTAPYLAIGFDVSQIDVLPP